jgi:hypothetical protein
LAIGLLVLVGINNGIQFSKAIDYFRVYHPSIHRLQSETELPVAERRPDFQKKISLSVDVGSTRMNGYLGPGGSFSPNENSFGLSIWAVNRDDVIATSDTFWPPGAVQEVSWERCGTLPMAKTAVHYFNTKVQVRKAQTWSVSIDQMGNFVSRLVLMVRGDGPSGGRINALDWDGHRLLINNRWILQLDFQPTGVQVGEEKSSGRFVKGGYHWASSKATGYALFELPETTHNWVLTITDPQPTFGVQAEGNFIPAADC